MKIFGGSDLVNEQNQKIRQLLGEGTGGMRGASAQPTNSNWRDVAKQNIQDIAGNNKQISRNFTYLERFKENLETRKFKPRNQDLNHIERFSRSRSEKKSPSINKKKETNKQLSDINTKQLLSAKRRFSETRKEARPRSAQPTSDLFKTMITGETGVKGSKVPSIIDSLQKIRASNIGPSNSILDSLLHRQKSEKRIDSASKGVDISRENTDRLLKTPAQWPKDNLTKSNLKTDLKSLMNQLEQKKPEKPMANFLTPKARLIFNNRREGLFNTSEQKEKDGSALKFDGLQKGKVFETFGDLQSYKSFIQTKREQDLNRLVTVPSKPQDSRVEYTRRFLENALGKPTVSKQKEGSFLKNSGKKSSILGDWFTVKGHSSSSLAK